MLQMNRPFGAVDVSANLKGAVAKAAAQKILVALAERGDVVQKTYGTLPYLLLCLLYTMIEYMRVPYQARRRSS